MIGSLDVLKVSMIVEENNQNKQGGRKLKTVDYCLQYGIHISDNDSDVLI